MFSYVSMFMLEKQNKKTKKITKSTEKWLLRKKILFELLKNDVDVYILVTSWSLMLKTMYNNDSS